MKSNDAHNDGGDGRKVTRRSVLRTISLGGSISLGGLSIGSARGEELTTIVTHEARDEPVITKEVPTSWVNHIEVAGRKKEQFADEYLHISGVERVGLRSGPRFGKAGEKNKYAIIVGVSKELGNVLPSDVDGIPVVIEEAKETMEPVCYNGGDYNPVPGGVKVESGGIATSMGAYYTDTNGDGYDESLLMTAAHLGSDCGGNPNGDTLYQNGDKYGTIVEFDEDLDTMLADSSSTSLSPEQTIQEPFSTISVYGSVTKSGTFDIEETGEIIYKMGIKTGRESGTLIDVQHQPGGCRDHNGEGIRADINVVQGDSGGPIYDVESGAAYMLSHASIAAAKSSNSECGGTVWEHTWGPAAYEIKNVHGGGFISGP